jgi:hypothetical protein
MLSVDERLSSIESGIVEIDNRFSKIYKWNDLDIVLESIRERTRVLYNRIATIKNTLKTSEEICKTIEAELEGKA